MTELEKELLAACEKLAELASLLTVRQVIEMGDPYIDIAGLNPWCINEGLATGKERLGIPLFAESAIEKAGGHKNENS